MPILLFNEPLFEKKMKEVVAGQKTKLSVITSQILLDVGVNLEFSSQVVVINGVLGGERRKKVIANKENK